MRRGLFILLAALMLAPYSAMADADSAGTDAGALLKQAREALKKQKFNDAIGLASAAKARDPQNVEALLRRAQAWLGLGNAAAAQKDLDEAVMLAPGDRNLLLERAKAFQSQQLFGEAVRDCTASLAIKKDPSVFLQRAELYELTGQAESAIADYTELLRYQPFRPDIYIARGKLYRKIGQAQKAGADFEQAVKLNPTFSVQVSKILSGQPGKPSVAKPTLAEVVPNRTAEAAPQIAPQLDAKVLVLKKKDAKPQKKQAPVEVAKATPPAPLPSSTPEPAKTEPEPPPPPPAPAVDPQAVKAASEVQAANSAMQKGRDLLKAGSFAEAAASFGQVITLRPKHAEAYMRRCSALFGTGKLQEAIADCNQAIQLADRDGDARYWRARAYLEQKDFERAIQDFSTAIDLKPYFPEAHFFRAKASLATDNLSLALYGFSEAYRQKQGYVEALEARASIRQLLGDQTGYQKDLELIKLASARK